MDTLILVLATWRISSLLVDEGGPWNIFEKMRYRLGVRYNENSEKVGTNVLSELLTCIWCTSIWVAVILTTSWLLWPKQTIWIMWPLALSAGAIMVEKIVADA